MLSISEMQARVRWLLNQAQIPEGASRLFEQAARRQGISAALLNQVSGSLLKCVCVCAVFVQCILRYVHIFKYLMTQLTTMSGV